MDIFLTESEKEYIFFVDNSTNEEKKEKFIESIRISEQISGKISRRLDYNTLLTIMVPENVIDAIELSYVRWGINIAYASRPLMEYKNLMKKSDKELLNLDKDTKDIFIDPIQSHLFERDHSYIKGRYITKLHSLYSKTKLDYFRDLEMIDILKSIKNKNWLYNGIYINYPIQDEYHTYFTYEKIETPNNIWTVSINNQLYLVSEEELLGLFKSNMNFTFLNELIDYHAIDKLYYYCLNIELKEVIVNIYKCKEKLYNAEKEILEYDVEDFKSFLDIIYDITMTLRGKDINTTGNLPIKSSDTQSNVDDFYLLEMNYTESINLLIDFINKDKNKRNKYINLPLLYRENISGNDNEYYVSNNSKVGRTIGAKLDMISDGKNDDACVRVSSNYLLWTLYYYSSLLNINYNIDIDNMSFIS